jgi:hypothetical protein
MKGHITILVLIVSLNCKAQERSPIYRDSVAPRYPNGKQYRKWMEYDSIQKAKWKATHKVKKDATSFNIISNTSVCNGSIVTKNVAGLRAECTETKHYSLAN